MSTLVPTSGKVLGWAPAVLSKQTVNDLECCYHEAAHLIYSHDQGCRPMFVDLGNPGWGVGHCGCMDEGPWFKTMAAGGAASYVMGQDYKHGDPMEHAKKGAAKDVAELHRLLSDVEADPNANGYKAPSLEDTEARIWAEFGTIGAEIKTNAQLRARLDALAKFLYDQYHSGHRQLTLSQFQHLL